jgi:hypothetical protein
MTLAGGGDAHRRSVDKLMELMILSGLLIEEPDGFVRWHEQAAHRPPKESASPGPDGEQTPQKSRTGTSRSSSSSHPDDKNHFRAQEPPVEERLDAEDVQTPSSEEPPPGTMDAGDGHTTPAYEDDPAELIAAPLWFRFVQHMTPDEAAQLHQHLHGVLSIVAQAHARARADTGTSTAELDQPLHLSDLGRVSLKAWLTVYASSREMSAVIPSMRSRQSTPQS